MRGACLLQVPENLQELIANLPPASYDEAAAAESEDGKAAGKLAAKLAGVELKPRG